jgi:LexA-binding, inner membrane-associated putative hydrolase
MQVPTHLALSWIVGHRLPDRGDRRLVAWAGVIPDLDALALLWGAGAYSEYHHVLSHNVFAGAVTALLALAFAQQKIRALLLALGTYHLHLVCDLLGSGRDWPTVYFYPLSRREYFTPYGWPLASPQNAAVFLAALAATVWIGITLGRTWGETFLPAPADAAIVKALRRRIPWIKPATSKSS